VHPRRHSHLVASAVLLLAVGSCTLAFRSLDEYEVTDASQAESSGGDGGAGEQGEGGAVGTTGQAGIGGTGEAECSVLNDPPYCLDGRLSRCVDGKVLSHDCGMHPCEDDRCGPSITITGLEDATVYLGNPNKNFGDFALLLVDTFEDENNKAVAVLLKPPPDAFAEVPPGLAITLAELRLWQIDRGDPINVRRILSDWSEDSVTWDTAPEVGDEVLVRVNAERQNTHLRIDITETVQDWIDNGNAYGIRLIATGDDGCDFYSSESNAQEDRLPHLVIYYRE
jgi:hypothetical protein